MCAANPVLAAVPNDPLYKDQWYLEAIGMPDAWNFAKGSPTVKVAVLDTGVDLSHPDLQDRIWTNRGEIPGDGADNDHNGYVDDTRGWDFVSNDNDPNPNISDSTLIEGTNHGTLVAGLIGAAGNNGAGISGVNWNLEIMPLRVLDSAGSGRTDIVEAAIRYAIAQDVQVINISFSGPSFSESLSEAVREAYHAGIVVVAAAGNQGDTERGGNLNVHPEYPACFKGTSGEKIVIGVSSLDAQGERSSFSNYGSDCISISAPGENIMTTQVFRAGVKGFEKPYGNGWAGSSMSAPLVSGVAALLFSMDPSMTPAEVRSFITAYAVNIDAQNGAYAGQLGAGRIDAAATVTALQAELLGAPPQSEIPGAPPPAPPGGELVKSAEFSTVYYHAVDGKRYVFPNVQTYATWFSDFTDVKTITVGELASLPIGGTVTYRPGTRLLKLQTRPEVYAVGKGGILRHVASETVAAELFGPSWALRVDDLPEAFFVDYRIGAEILRVSDYNPAAESASAPTIEADRNLLPKP